MAWIEIQECVCTWYQCETSPLRRAISYLPLVSIPVALGTLVSLACQRGQSEEEGYLRNRMVVSLVMGGPLLALIDGIACVILGLQNRASSSESSSSPHSQGSLPEPVPGGHPSSASLEDRSPAARQDRPRAPTPYPLSVKNDGAASPGGSEGSDGGGTVWPDGTPPAAPPRSPTLPRAKTPTRKLSGEPSGSFYGCPVPPSPSGGGRVAPSVTTSKAAPLLPSPSTHHPSPASSTSASHTPNTPRSASFPSAVAPVPLSSRPPLGLPTPSPQRKLSGLSVEIPPPPSPQPKRSYGASEGLRPSPQNLSIPGHLSGGASSLPPPVSNRPPSVQGAPLAARASFTGVTSGSGHASFQYPSMGYATSVPGVSSVPRSLSNPPGHLGVVTRSPSPQQPLGPPSSGLGVSPLGRSFQVSPSCGSSSGGFTSIPQGSPRPPLIRQGSAPLVFSPPFTSPTAPSYTGGHSTTLFHQQPPYPVPPPFSARDRSLSRSPSPTQNFSNL